jgi:saccharopine dehydrogenase-like NADP-dependent oxidoreductase
METIKSKAQNVLHINKTPETGKTVLITGGSGFVAAHVLNAFLSRGYNVRTTVRNQASAEKIKKSHAKYLPQLSFAIVPDVAIPGGHDEAVRGVDGVRSLTSPPQNSKFIPKCAGHSHNLPLSNDRQRQRT